MSAGEMWDELERVREENRSLRAEVERLREALQQLIEAADDCLPMTGKRPVDVYYYKAKLHAIFNAAGAAKEALSKKQEI